MLEQKISDYQTLLNNTSGNKRLLSLDISKNNLGLAISDENLLIAFPLITIKRVKFTKDLESLLKIINKENIYALVAGMPFDGDGSLNFRTQSTETFIFEVKKHISLPIFIQDERFSTYFARNDNIIGKNRKDDVDSKAAAIILQNFLDGFHNYKKSLQ